MSELGWMPDGRGLADLARDLIAKEGGKVHLRITSPDGRSARGACDRGLGEWWSGRSNEVNCPDCLELVHA